jgi:3-oxoacyl-[acyl-carrier protein] reductase
MPGLTDKTALVTGASRGIGRYTAQRLARDGARAGVHYGTNEQAAKEVVASIQADGGSAFALQADLAVPHAASVMPSIPAANTNATVLAIAERAADLITDQDQ